MKKILLGIVVGVILVFIGLFLFVQFYGAKYFAMFDDMNLRSPELSMDSVVDANASLRFEVTDIRSGKAITTDSIFSNKVVVLNFWEQWCSPCRYEMMTLNKLDSLVKDSSVVFGIISTENMAKMKKDPMLKLVHLPFYHLNSTMPEQFSGTAIPRTYIINKKGELLVREVGASNWQDETVVQLIDSLKNEK